MSDEMSLPLPRELARARRSYERGRLRSSAQRALFVAAPIAIVGLAVSGEPALPWIPVAYLAWVLAWWRGDAFFRGAMYGLAGGVVTFLLPMSILRPCCAPGAMPNMGTACCTMPGICLGAGAVVGIALAAVVPFGKASWWRTATGMALGMASMAIVRCASLFVGEAVGLLGGLTAGVVAASLAKSLLRARATS